MSIDLLSQIGRRIGSFAPSLTAAAIFAATFLGCDGPRSEPSITISKETSYITEPLRPDGLPDYERWLLEKYRDGVTHENNAGVLIYQAIWPAGLEPADYQLICNELGLAAIPSADGALRDFPNEELLAVVRSFLVDRGVEMEDDSLAEDAIYATADAAWTTQDLPPLAEWLTTNQEAIDLVVEATNRPRLYLPSPSLLYDKHVTLVAMLLPGVQGSLKAARALTVRSMWHLGEGRLTEAWNDALALHRLACLSSQGKTVVEKLVAIAMRGMAQDATLAILSQEEIPLELARQIQTDLAKLDSRVSIAESLGTIERVTALDTALRVYLDGPERPSGESSFGSPADIRRFRSSINWNIVLKDLNRYYNRLMEAVGVADCDERARRLKEFEVQLQEEVVVTKSLAFVTAARYSRSVRSLCWATAIANLMLPETSNVLMAEDRNTTKSQLLDVAVALAVYRAEHGEYPNDLDALVPDLLPKLPVDTFHARPLHYQRTADGYLLYSLGENGIDDGGSHQDWDVAAGVSLRSMSDDEADAARQQMPKNADDISIRLPRPPFKLPEPPTPESDTP